MRHIKNALLVSAVSALVVLNGASAPQVPAIANRAAQTTLFLGGVDAGPVAAFDKGGCYAEVIPTSSSNPAVPVSKHVGRLRSEPLQLSFGLTNPASVYEWIRQSWSGQPARRSGMLLIADPAKVSPLSREFSNALIAETTIPGMDKAGRDPVWLNIKVSAETIAFLKGSVEPKPSAAAKKGVMVESDFSFEITGMDCSSVATVDEFTVKQELVEYMDANDTQLRLRPGRLTFPNIKLTVSEAGAQPFIDWYDDFVVRGNNVLAQHRQGKMTLFSKVGGKRLTVTLKNLGIIRICPAKHVGDATTRRLEVEMYVESMDLIVEDTPQAGAARALATVAR